MQGERKWALLASFSLPLFIIPVLVAGGFIKCIAEEMKSELMILLVVLLAAGCSDPQGGGTSKKITFDLENINEEGLEGPADGLRAVSYEFCIPREEEKVTEVKRIDPTVEVYASSPGRIGCSSGEYLCIGNTHQPGFRKVLYRLAALDYIERIDQAFFE